MDLLMLLICLFTSIIGTICGIGGGVIIKPVLDSFRIFDVAEISFLSGCTVLAMSLFSVMSIGMKKKSSVNLKGGTVLAAGAAIGGLIGKSTFNLIWTTFDNKNMPGLIQAICLLMITLASFMYMTNKNRIKTHAYSSHVLSVIVGILLGLLSSFLGIGGGPINLVVLFYLFSMDIKTAAANSLCIILISQITSLASAVLTHTIPGFDMLNLLMMVAGGIAGSVIGRMINSKINEKTVEKLYLYMMGIIIIVSIYNVYIYSINS